MMPFWIALQFLTILPVQLDRMPTAEENARAVLFYPVVGLLLGGLLYALALLLVPVPTILTAVFITLFWIG
ncbi:adenosylcobinamide-GDP ribazoletransferase, partial [uncultured Acinetobacter sp.]